MCHLFWDGPFGVAFGCEAQFGWEIHDMDLGVWWRCLWARCAVLEAATSRIVQRQGYCSQEIEIEGPVLTLCGLGGYNFSDCAAPRLLFTRD